MCREAGVSFTFSLLATRAQLQDTPPPTRKMGFLVMLSQMWDSLPPPPNLGSLSLMIHFQPRSPSCKDNFWKLSRGPPWGCSQVLCLQ